MTAEPTYDRYRRILREIAAGAANPAELAAAALESRAPLPRTSEKHQLRAEAAERYKSRREARKQHAAATYTKWMELGRPPIAAYARELGMHPTTLRNLLSHAEKGWPWRWCRIRHSTGDRTYRTNGEIYREEHGEEYQEVP